MSLPKPRTGAFKSWYPEYIVLVGNGDERKATDASKNDPEFKDADVVWLTFQQAAGLETVLFRGNILGVYRKAEEAIEGAKVEYFPAESWYSKSIHREVTSVLEFLSEHGAKRIKLKEVTILRKEGVEEKPLKSSAKPVRSYKKLYGRTSRLQPNTFDKPDKEKLLGWQYVQKSTSIRAAIRSVWEDKDDEGLPLVVEYEVKQRQVVKAQMLSERWNRILDPKSTPKKTENQSSEHITVQLEVKFARILNGPWPKYSAYSPAKVERNRGLLRQILHSKVADEAAFGAVRLVFYGAQNAGKSCTIYSWMRAEFGKHGYRYKENRSAPPQMNVRPSNSVPGFERQGTFFDPADEATYMNFYRLLKNTRYGEGNRYFGSLILCDTEGIDQEFIAQLGRRVEANGEEQPIDLKKLKKLHTTTLKKKTDKFARSKLTKEDANGELGKWGWTTAIVHSLLCGPIVPDVQVFVISAEEFVTNRTLFTGSCKALAEFRKIAAEEGGIVDDFVVLLTKYDKFEEACNGRNEQTKAAMMELVGEYLPKRRRGGAQGEFLAPDEYVFTIANHTVPTDQEIEHSVGSQWKEEQLQWTERNDQALDTMHGILQQVQSKRATLNDRSYNWMKARAFQWWREKNINEIHDIFLSYNQKRVRAAFDDEKCAIDIVRNGLVHCGLTVQCDTQNEHRDFEQMFEHVKEAKVFLAVLTENYLDSDVCLAELICAYAAETKIVLVVGLNEDASREARHSRGDFDPERILRRRLEKDELKGLMNSVRHFYKQNNLRNFVEDTLKEVMRHVASKFAVRLAVKPGAVSDVVAQEEFLRAFAKRWNAETGEHIVPKTN